MKYSAPKLGARTIKTALTIFLCTLIPPLLGRTDTLIASVSGLVCMQNSIEDSVNTGKSRLIGTVIGAIIGICITYVGTTLNAGHIANSLIAGLGVMLVIYLCILFDIKAAITIACVVTLCIFINVGDSEWLIYSINRTIDTLIGVLIGVNVNKYICKTSFKKARKEK